VSGALQRSARGRSDASVCPNVTSADGTYPHQDGFFPGAPQMLSERLESLSPEAKHQVLAGGALGFYGLS
jgi:hypothetical protein